MLGDGAVGKTCTVIRLTKDEFGKSYKQTLGLDFFNHSLVLQGDVNVTQQIWDIGGQSISGKMIGNYIFGAHAVVFLYDITNYASFQNLEDWYGLVKRRFEKDGVPMPYMALVGNKTDLSHMRTVKVDKHTAFAKDNGMKSFFISAKTGDQVNTTFTKIAADLAGVTLRKPDVEVATKVVHAEIVDHPTHNEGEPEKAAKGKKKCAIM